MKKSKKKNGAVFLRLIKYLFYEKKLLVPAALLALLGAGADLALPLLTGHAIDCIIGVGRIDLARLTEIMLKMAVTILVMVASQYLSGVCISRLCARVVKRLRLDCFLKLDRLPLKYFDTTPRGDIISLFLTDAETTAEGLQQLLEQLFSGLVLCAGSLVLAFTISWRIALCLVAVSPLYFLIASFIAKGSRRLFAKQQNLLGELSGRAEETISMLETARDFGLEEDERLKFADVNGKLNNVGWRAQFYSALVNPSTRLIVNSSYVLVGALGAIGIIGGSLTLGLVSSLLTYANQYSKPINELTGVMTQLQASLAAAKRLFTLLEQEEERDESELPAIDCADYGVEFRNVSFSYDPDIRLIENLNLSLPGGGVVAIVGKTGAGKTTLVNLLMRYYEPTDGAIYIGGSDISLCSRASVRRRFAMVLQDTWIFGGTIRENIAFSRPDATEQEIIAAAKAAHAHSFIKRLPGGYDHVISGDGTSLSQGQQQLLTIARAMLVRAPMLILDEATSSVDTMTEVRIQKAFKNIMKGRTCFVIAHRLSTIRDADVILVMEDGAVIEQGTNEQLLRLGGAYARLVAASAGAVS